MSAAIENLLHLGAIEKCEARVDQFISSIFLADKGNGGRRFILNLKRLNKNINKVRFKMEDFRTASKMTPYNGLMATIDLKEAYLRVPIAKSSRKYLRFRFDNDLYEFTAMPYGLSSAPRTFTKIMKEVITYLRTRGYKSVVYLDDILCIGDTYDECLTNINETLRLLNCLGFVVNYDKSCLQPTQKCKFLGFIYNSIDMTISLPSDKRKKIRKLVQKFSRLPVCTIREFAQLIGVLTSACPAIKYSWLYTKTLERQKYLALEEHGSYDVKIRTTANILPDLQWWSRNILTAVNSLTVPSFELEIFTDASLTGWGAFCNNNRVNGGWKDSELHYHINQLELLAVFLGLKSFARKKHNCNILLRVDNTTAISYVNRMGGIQFPHLTDLTKDIWQWCEERNIWLFASYINTKDNVEADQESRKANPDIEWQLPNTEFQKIVSLFGTPEIDLFASRTNAKCKTYVSWKQDPDAFTVDAFTLDWNHMYFYAFPPCSLILKCIRKIINDKAEGIFIFPNWPSQPWFPLLKSIIRSDIFYVSLNSNPSSSFRTTQRLSKQITLGAAVLSGKLS